MSEPKMQGVEGTVLTLSEIRPGRTYWCAHAIQKPDGSLLGHGKRLPKLFDDPAYCPRLIATLAKQGGVEPAQIGKPVVVALVRVVQEGEEPDVHIPVAQRKKPSEPIFVVSRPGPDGKPRFTIEFGDFRSHADKEREPGTRRLQLPEGWKGGLDEARAFFEGGAQ